MSTPETSSIIPEGLIYQDRAALEAKITRFIGATASKLHFVFDFDRTLTVPHHHTKEDITSWGILRDHLPLERQAQCAALFTTYRAKELDGSMTVDDAVTWWSSVLDIYTESHLDMSAVEKDFLLRASIRDGAHDLLRLNKTKGIPNAVLSAGIRDVIELWADAFDSPLSPVISTVLKLDEQRKIVGWDKDTLVHVLNKGEADHKEITSIRESRPFAIIVGDGMGDADMASGDETTLRIRVLDPRDDELMQNERKKTFTKFDALIENGSLEPITRLIERIGD